MATINIELDKRTCKEGRYPVRFRLYCNRTTSYIYTDAYVSEEEFTGNKYTPINSKRAYMYAERTERISRIARKFDEVEFKLSSNGVLQNLTANELRDYIVAKKQIAAQVVRKASSKTSTDFLIFFDQYAADRRCESTRDHYRYISRLLMQYCSDRGLRTILFDEIDYEMLVDIKRWVRNGKRGEPTRFKLESYMKAAYREGMRLKKVDRKMYPYFDYHIEGVPEAEIETIGIETIRRLISIDLTKPGTDRIIRARDALLASFMMGGANLLDLYNISSPIGNELSFIRHKIELKTKRPVRINIEPELAEIISRNKSCKRMLNWQERFTCYKTFRRNLNHGCDLLSEQIGTNINMELIRRSYATIASSIGIPDYAIDALMGHKSQTVLRRFYAKIDWNIIWKYNRQLIDYLYHGKLPQQQIE